MLGNGQVELKSIEIGSKEHEMFEELTQHPEPGFKIIGDGEAAAISFAVNKDGVLASNNLKDIKKYIEKYSIKHITTGDILKKAMDKFIISEEEGNDIWNDMMNRQRWLGADSFTEFLRKSE